MAEPGGELTVGVLGPFEVAVDGRPVALTSGRLRTLLAALALTAGRPASAERLATALWDDDPPDNARRSVQTYLTRLRAALGADRITTGPTGYQLRINPDRVDALRFARLLDHAAQATDPETERARLTEALDLWRGTPFDGIRSDRLERTEAPRLTERHLTAIERRIDLDLAAGHHDELVAPLRELVAQHPLRESLWVRLLLTLDKCGRQAEALERYETIRVRLADELGTDPGPELRQVHTDLLAGRPADPTPTTRPVTPRQLPADTDAFTGRETALKALNDLISEGDGRSGGAVVISVIAGTAGVGKTALAVHWAHQVADRFPDGQLYLNLRGFGSAQHAGPAVTPAGPAVTPAEAVREFLDALGVPTQRVPSNLDAQAALYRSLLADKRMLVLLDNARDADQVRPLLPGSPGCLVIVTSRDQLTSLVATVGARPLVLDLLPLDEARGLLARRLGADRIAAEPAATDEIITSCARLPLALAIAAARAATRPGFRLKTVAAELRDARQGGLAALTAGDPSTDVRTVFSWSYRTLGPGAARLFRLLGLHPGPDTTVDAAASLVGLPEPQARPLLAELTQAHLLTEHQPGRYTFHDLLRAFAAELAEAHDPEDARRAARHRLLDHFLHTGFAAARLLNPHRDLIGLAAPQPGVVGSELTDHRGALDWFTTELPVLLAAVDHAAGAGFDTHTWQLAWTLRDYLDRRGHWWVKATTLRAALAATQRLDARSEQARTHRDLGRTYTQLGDDEQAHTHLRRAIDLYGEVGDDPGRAHTQINVVWLLERQGRYREALDQARQALQLYQASGHRVGRANALNAVGWCLSLLEDHRQALGYCQQALTLLEELGDRRGQADTWDSLGRAHHQLGEYQRAIDCHRHALDLYRELANRYYEGDALGHLGDAYRATGDHAAARDAWQQALTILDELDHPDATRIRADLARLAGANG